MTDINRFNLILIYIMIRMAVVISEIWKNHTKNRGKIKCRFMWTLRSLDADYNKNGTLKEFK